jgi:hypothetical protein
MIVFVSKMLYVINYFANITHFAESLIMDYIKIVPKKIQPIQQYAATFSPLKKTKIPLEKKFWFWFSDFVLFRGIFVFCNFCLNQSF